MNIKFLLSMIVPLFVVTSLMAEPLNPEQKEKITAKLEQLKLLGTDPAVISE